MIPTDPLAIEIGLQRNRAIDMAQQWNSEAIRWGELAWNYCDARGWTSLDLTFNGIKIIDDDDDDDDESS